MSTKIPVAVIQARPAYYDLEASVEKAIGLIEEAARQGARLITLGETWLPGYPAWLDNCPSAALWHHEPTKAVFERLVANSVAIPSKQINIFCQLAKRLNVVLVLSINEKVESGPGNGTFYNTLITIDTDGEIVNRHRKLMPTYSERLVWGQGDASGLKAVETEIGRVGGLICWEHWMPLARQAMHNSAEQIHVAVWPTVKGMHQIASRHYAFEGRSFVLAAGSIMRVDDLPSELDVPDDLNQKPKSLVMHGGSAIIGPNGKYIVEPIFDEETILTAELDLSDIVRESMTLDVTGHYARPDLFDFGIKS